MYFWIYGLLELILKSAQNAKFAVNHTLRWNNSNLITLNSYMGEMNSGNISVLFIYYLLKILKTFTSRTPFQRCA